MGNRLCTRLSAEYLTVGHLKVLDENIERILKWPECQKEAIEVAELLSSFIGRSLGPRGFSKLIVNEDGATFVSRNGAFILSRLKFEHPIAQVIVNAAKCAKREIGDGSKRVVIIVGELLKARKKIWELHPQEFIRGYCRAAEKCSQIIHEISVPFHFNDSSVLSSMIKTSLNVALPSAEKSINRVLFKGLNKVIKSMNNSLEQSFDDNIMVEKDVGKTDFRLIEGLAFFKEKGHPHMPSFLKNVGVAVIQERMYREKLAPKTKSSRYHEYQIIFNRPRLRSYQEEKIRFFREMTKKLVELNVNLLICGGGLNPYFGELLSKAGILALRCFHIDDLGKIAKALGARVSVGIEYLTPRDIGFADSVVEKKLGHRPWIFIHKKGSPIVTILLRGPSDGILNEMRENILCSIQTIKRAFLQPRILAGGGATEIEVSIRLKKWARSFSDRMQITIQAFANALEAIPNTLAETCGLKPIDCVPELRKRHYNGEKWSGVDVIQGKIANMFDLKVYEPAVVMEKTIELACTTACKLLQIGGFIKARRLRGPELYGKKIEEATRPEKVKKFWREHGIAE